MLNARSKYLRQILARAAVAPDVNKCALIAAVLAGILMLSIGLTLG